MTGGGVAGGSDLVHGPGLFDAERGERGRRSGAPETLDE
jgi:hypothetical protein